MMQLGLLEIGGVTRNEISELDQGGAVSADMHGPASRSGDTGA